MDLDVNTIRSGTIKNVDALEKYLQGVQITSTGFIIRDYYEYRLLSQLKEWALSEEAQDLEVLTILTRDWIKGYHLVAELLATKSDINGWALTPIANNVDFLKQNDWVIAEFLSDSYPNNQWPFYDEYQKIVSELIDKDMYPFCPLGSPAARAYIKANKV